MLNDYERQSDEFVIVLIFHGGYPQSIFFAITVSIASIFLATDPESIY